MFDYASEYSAARKQLSQWLGEGKLQRKETIIKGGLKASEEALNYLFKGKNIGRFLGQMTSTRTGLTQATSGKLMVEVKPTDEGAKL